MDNKLTISFGLVDEFGNEYSATSKTETFEDLGVGDIETIGEQLNNFLRQCGYVRKNNYIFMDDVNEDEYEAIADFLADYRHEREKVVDRE